MNDTISILLVLLMACAVCGCVSEDELTGQLFDSARECWGETRQFEFSGDQGCNNAITYARDDDGRLWKFFNTCIPDGLEPSGFDDVGYPECR